MNGMRWQKVWGAVLIILCIGVIGLARQGTTPDERDITPVLFFAPLGVSMIVTKERVVYDPNKNEGGSCDGKNQD